MNAEPERAPSPPPLLAYTASQLDSKKGKGKQKASQQRNGKKTAAAAQLKRRRPQRATEPVVFDDAARHEFLTGFRKRKQARIENSKQKAKEREKEERRKSRSEAQKARKEQAAENVRMEKIAYGGGVEENDDDDDDDGAREFSPSAFESEEHHTTVVVQEWNPDEEDKPAKSKPEKPVKKAQAQLLELPPSSRRMAKKLKNAGKRGGSGVADAREISRLIDDGAAPKVYEPTVYDQGKAEAEEGEEGDNGKDAAKAKTAKKPAKFHYESKLERAKARAKIREDKAKFAERRKEERKRINMQKGLKRRRKK